MWFRIETVAWGSERSLVLDVARLKTAKAGLRPEKYEVRTYQVQNGKSTVADNVRA